MNLHNKSGACIKIPPLGAVLLLNSFDIKTILCPSCPHVHLVITCDDAICIEAIIDDPREFINALEAPHVEETAP